MKQPKKKVLNTKAIAKKIWYDGRTTADREQIAEVVGEVFEVMKRAVFNGDEIAVREFFKLSTFVVPPCTIKLRGERTQIKPKRRVRFKVSRKFKTELNKNIAP